MFSHGLSPSPLRQTSSLNTVTSSSVPTSTQVAGRTLAAELSAMLRQFSQNPLFMGLVHSTEDINLHAVDSVRTLESMRNYKLQLLKSWGVEQQDMEGAFEESFGHKMGRIPEPICAQTADFVGRVLLEHPEQPRLEFMTKNSPFQTIDTAALQARLSQTDPTQAYCLRVQDRFLGHAYTMLVSGQEADGERKCFLFQSDLGDGATPALKMSDWAETRANAPIPLGQFLDYAARAERAYAGNTSAQPAVKEVASLFLLDQNPAKVNAQKFSQGNKKGMEFVMQPVDVRIAVENLTRLQANAYAQQHRERQSSQGRGTAMQLMRAYNQ